jgi:hypothetical protein
MIVIHFDYVAIMKINEVNQYLPKKKKKKSVLRL